MQKRKVLINAVMSIAQVIVISSVLFILYRFLLGTIGVEQLGVWSLVLATTSVIQAANFGLSGSVVKFVAKYVARREDNNVSGVIQTAVISLSVIVGLLLIIGYPLIKWIFSSVIPLSSLPLVLRILPIALFSLWLTTVTSVYQAGLDGFQRIYIRNIIIMAGSIFYAILCFILAPKYGLIGLAYAQIINNFAVLITSLFFIKIFLPALPIVPYQWNRGLFAEIIFYGISFQVISVTQMFYDPITKIFLSKFGGLSVVGYYEMANKMIQQFRALIVSVNQVLVPFIAGLHENNPAVIRSVYLFSYNLFFYLALPLYTLIIINIPFISAIWIGHYEKVFVVFGTLLSIGCFFNTLCAPAYFENLGTGALRWNVITQILIGVLNVGLAFILGPFLKGTGVIIAWVIALSLGSGLLCLEYQLVNRIPLGALFPKESRLMFFSYTVISTVALFVQSRINPSYSSLISNSSIVIIPVAFVLITSWFHPMRNWLIAGAQELIFNKTRIS
jgi:O-antigen/teichoic acid export membrane protein